MSIDRIITSRRVIIPEGVTEAALVISDGKIQEIVVNGQIPTGTTVEDYGDLVIMPGLVDTHVHINEPGRTLWEGFETATKAAAAGGITTLVDMPLNSSPVTTNIEALRQKIAASEGNCYVDWGPHGGLVQGNADQMTALINAGVLGIKAFLIDSGIDEFSNALEPDIREAMPILARANMPLLVHAELPGPAPTPNDPTSYADYLASRPREWEGEAIRWILGLCAEYQCPIHIVHLASADAIPELAAARASGLPVTVETCPHYLYFDAETIPNGATQFKCAPPIRERENRERLWEGLKHGVIDFVASDHSPCPPELKQLESGDFFKAWGGIASLQLGLPIMWTEAQRHGATLTDLWRWMCARPSQLAGLSSVKGRFHVGADADIVIWNPEAEFIVTPSELYHRHPVTPYENQTLSGVVTRTILRGQTIYDQGGKFSEEPLGQLLLRKRSV